MLGIATCDMSYLAKTNVGNRILLNNQHRQTEIQPRRARLRPTCRKQHKTAEICLMSFFFFPVRLSFKGSVLLLCKEIGAVLLDNPRNEGSPAQLYLSLVLLCFDVLCFMLLAPLCFVLLCVLLPCLVLSCLVLSGLALPCPALPCLALPCLARVVSLCFALLCLR